MIYHRFFKQPALNCFIAVYTNEVKDYCDRSFFSRLARIGYENQIHIIDNSNDDKYLEHLRSKYSGYNKFNFYHIHIEREPKESLFHRRVAESVLFLREKFLATNLPYFLILESDVIPPRNLLLNFESDIAYLDQHDPQWGILGGLYHRNFHRQKLKGLQKTHHVLSGCTIYKRELIEKYPFRWSEENMGAFPDAWISLDSKKEFGLYNDHRIHCGHIENVKTGTRQSGPL